VKGKMLQAMLLAGIVAAPFGSAALFLPVHRHARNAGTWPALRRFGLAVVGTVVLAMVVAVILKVIGASSRNLSASVAGVVIASLVWLPVTRRWSAQAHMCWSSTVFLFAVYLVYAFEWTLDSHLGTASTVGGLVLCLLEILAALLCCAYLWEICDALGTENWRRRITRDTRLAVPDDELPMISLHVPAHNEPPDMVIETLRSLLSLDYPRYEIILIDDNTDDESLWRPVQTWCHQHGLKFAHLDDWPGYKSGALNYALRRLTSPQAELIGVVDSDYQIEPGFLRRCAPAFADPWIGFVQSPQNYRDWAFSQYYRRLYYSYAYFFAVSQPSRNEHDGAIFAGTMGLIRRVALDALGGWDEWCITEDAELSLRLLRAGWSGQHVDESFGHGIMPLTFEALKGQRYRWCFGGIQLLRMHWRSMMPGRKDRENHLSTGQRWAYLSGAAQWYGDLLGLVFLIFLLAGAANLATGGGQLFRKLTLFLVAAVPVMVLLGLVRAVALLRRGTGASWRDAIGAFFIWQSTSLVVARASVLGLFLRKAAFLRTPKTSEETRWWEALRSNWAESALALLGFIGIGAALTKATQLSGPLLAVLLLFPTLGMAAAPYNSWAARRAQLPAWLRDRRRTEYRRDRHTFAVGMAAGGVVAVLGVAIAAVALLLTGHHSVQTPNLVGPAQGTHAAPARSPGSSSSIFPLLTSPIATRHSAFPSVSPSPSSTAPASLAPTSPTATSLSASSSASPSPSSVATATPTSPAPKHHSTSPSASPSTTPTPTTSTSPSPTPPSPSP
jgi:cellulose synthase/poly-beta-1,6-N-acetylglucosamine synthase-like glycosyltransferase